MSDQIISYHVEGVKARIFAVDSTNTVREAQKIHQTSHTVTAAFGRMISAAAMMSLGFKNEKDQITVDIQSEGPVKRMLVVVNAKGEVKGDVAHPQIDLPLKENGKLDVSLAVGEGTLTVIKDLGLKQPYIGRTPLVSGEIAEDFTKYFAQSEQTPSVVALGVLVDRDGGVLASGGYMIQLLPECEEETISYIESRLQAVQSVSSMIEKDPSLDRIIETIFPDRKSERTSEKGLIYHCDCSKERFARGLVSLGDEEIDQIIREEGQAEIVCHFCKKEYLFDEEELRSIHEKTNKDVDTE